MLMTSRQLANVPIKFGFCYYFVNKRTINRWVKAGKLKVEKIKNKNLVSRAEFIAFAKMNYYPKD